MQVDDRAKVNARITGAFKMATDATGASFDQLLATAQRESDGRAGLASSTSSAKGLFQFVDQTWLELVKKEGPSVGLSQMSDAIASDGKGGWAVADPQQKAKILSLRSDPLVSSVMAAKFTQSNTRSLTESLGRSPTEGEVYAAHVLGASGAARLIRLARTEPTVTASVAFPRAAAANTDLFYGKDGQARTVGELLGRLTGGDGGARIAAAHAAVSDGAATKLDPAAFAAVIRAQAAAKVGGEGMTSGADQTALARFTRTAFAEKALPGASRSDAPPVGAQVDGWRAKAASDAFSMLMRSDAASASETSDAEAPTTVTPIGFAATASSGRGVVGGAIGGIPYVDPNRPMDLLAGPATAGRSDAGAGTSASALAARAAIGAPAMPLPMVAGGTVVTPSRLMTASAQGASDETAPSGLLASGAARVKTVSIAPAAAIGSTTSTRATDGSSPSAAGAATRATQTASARSGRSNKPLDLLALARGGDLGS